MIRAAFLSGGMMIALFGCGLLFVDDVQFSQRASNHAKLVIYAISTPDVLGRRHFRPPEWMPFSLMGLGTITMLYGVALPKA